MSDFFWIRAILSGAVGLIIGLIVIAVASLTGFLVSIDGVLILVCFATFFAGFLGYIIGAYQKKPQ
jgi:hypothetical protein